MNFDNTYAIIDLDAIEANFRAVMKKAGVPVMAIVKANAYGHGAVPVATMLQDLCAFFGVATVSEALELRQAGLTKPILLLGHTPVSAFPQIIGKGIRPAIFRYEDAKALSEEAVRQGITAPFHFAVDTGMSRIGFQVTEEDADICAKIARLPGLRAEGLFSHFATADSSDLELARQQANRYDRFNDMLLARGVEIPIRHLNNSAGTMNFSNHYDMVRAGIVIYGLYPSDEVDPNLLPLKPAMSWHSYVSHVKLLEPSRRIGYGGTFETTKPTLVATVPAGYADGYPRNLSNRFYVLIGGKKAPILGRVCMDQLMVDVTDIPDVTPGTPVVLMGCSGEECISAELIGGQAYSFNYEFVCDVGHRVVRYYRQGGQTILRKNYLLDK